MEKALDSINNILSRKQIVYYEIQGVPNKDGVLKYEFSDKQNFHDTYDYHVSLYSFQASSFFPNITDKNNTFFYYNGIEDKEIIFDTGAYEIKDINQHIKDIIGNEDIKIILDEGTGKSKIFLKAGYKVYLNRAKTFKKILGYSEEENYVLTSLLNTSPKMCDVMDTSKIFINLDIIEGSYFNKEGNIANPSSILYSFSNSVEYGRPIEINVLYKQLHKLIKKSFSKFEITFKDQKDNPINFQETPVSLTIEVSQI